MPSLLLVLVVIALGLGGVGLTSSVALRRVSRGLAVLLCGASAILTALSLYGMFALRAKGGGVLLFAALPGAFFTWLFFHAWSTSEHYETYLASDPDERSARHASLLDLQIAEHERTIEADTRALQRFWITPAKRRRLRDNVAHARFMITGLAAMRAGASSEPAAEKRRGTSRAQESARD